MKRLLLIGTAAYAVLGSAAMAAEPVTLWFWGAPPNLQDAFEEVLVGPFNASQDEYELQIEFLQDVDNDVRTAVLAGEGPDLVYTSGPSYIAPLARAGAIEPLDAYAEQYGWHDRLLEPVLDTCYQLDHLYCMPPALISDGMFYNRALLEEKGWEVPTTLAEVEQVMDAAIADGLYASVTGNKGWQPVNENYASIFINNVVGPARFYEILSTGEGWDSAEMIKAIEESARWFKAGYLGGSDYFSLNFDESISLVSQKRSPFFFAPSIGFQWATNYFTGDAAGDFAFAPIPQMDESLPYPIYDLGVAFTLSINANSDVKDGAAAVLDLIFSPEFASDMADVWPGYWGIPLREFPTNPDATGLTASFLDAMADMTAAVDAGTFGFKIGTFFPPATSQVMFEDIESVWLDRMTAQDMLAKAASAYADEMAQGLTQDLPQPSM
ncbi:ABC transporter substrate-binding protein [Pelagibacterium halotolerans]|nr:ABC transporter substrate-binding protein [Pelagibacterium halotolerans]QJR19231.1 carbohydrate ABC transporter substrate-binding protein [Pelagibacterium halotolerans]SDZ98180.1 carbohydrate ABC transporter substrate-binding protein, CUT1 family [Pelagibacterium halotolerans]